MTTSGSSGTTHTYAGLPDYLKDDFIVFRTNHTYEMNDGTVKNPSLSVQVFDKGNWEFTNGEKTLLLKSTTPNTEYIPWNVSILTETTLEVKFAFLGELRSFTYTVF